MTIPTTTDDAGHVDAGKRAGQRVSARTGVRLADHTTLRLGGSARRFVEATHTDAVIDAVRAADASGDPVLLLGGGSNLVVGDDGFAGTVIKIANAGRAIAVPDDTVADIAPADAGPGESTGRTNAVPTHDDDTVHIDVAAGENWDDVVAWTVDNGLGGLECLSGIPGLAGATPIQNVGAYGVEVAELLVSVDVFERASGTRRTVPAAELGLAFRTSVLKGTDRAVVLGMRFALHGDGQSRPIRYAELARTLDVEVGARVPAADARAAVLELRRRKAMVLDANDHDTWSAGSFFVNPILSPTELDDVLRRIAEHTEDRPPTYPAADGATKLPAGWLIEHAGFRRGHAGAGGRVALSSKHTLALTNRGGASTADLLALADEVRAGVHAAFGVLLRPEPVLVGCSL